MVKLDAIDINILAEIQADARITNVRLAERVGLSQSPCLQRLRRLEQSGFIRGYQGVIDLGKLVDLVTVFTEITLSDHRREDFLRFERALEQQPTVLECHLISGGFDYLVKFAARHIGHYQQVIEQLLDDGIGIAKYFSYIVIKSPIEPRPPALSLYV